MTIFPSRLTQPILKRSVSLFLGSGATVMAASSTSSAPVFSSRSYKPSNTTGPFPYSPADLTPGDSGDAAAFYSVPRFVTHIDDNAISNLRQYYDSTLPRKGVILDFCSSWISHYPLEVEDAAKTGSLKILGTAMNKAELSKNPVLTAWNVQDLNQDPEIDLLKIEGGEKGEGSTSLDAATCVVSIDYLTKPIEVLSSLRRVTKAGGVVHLVISNRCFPTKVVGRWLKVDENARLEMVGDYLWWSGWRDIEILTVVDGNWLRDPLWVVRGSNPEETDQS